MPNYAFQQYTAVTCKTRTQYSSQCQNAYNSNSLLNWYEIEITNFVNPPSVRRSSKGWAFKIEAAVGYWFDSNLNEGVLEDGSTWWTMPPNSHSSTTLVTAYHALWSEMPISRTDFLVPPQTIGTANSALTATKETGFFEYCDYSTNNDAPDITFTFTTNNQYPSGS